MQVGVSSRELSDLARTARRSGRSELTKEAAKQARKVLQPVVPEVRQAYKAVPSYTGRQRSARAVAERPRGFRDAAARGVQIKVSFSGKFAGVRLRVDPRHFPDGQRHLIQYWEGLLPRWRSPNWGRDEWKQQPAHPTFYPTIRPHIPRVRAEMRTIADGMSDQLGGS